MQRKTEMSQNPDIWALCDYSKTAFNLHLKCNPGLIMNTKAYVAVPI